MKTITTLLIVAMMAYALPTHAAKQDMIYFTDPEALGMLEQPGEKGDFVGSVRYFVSEVKQTYCAIASSVIVLNSLEVKSPVAPEIYPYQKFDQQNIFTQEVLEKYSALEVEEGGLTLEEAVDLISVYAVNAEMVFASDSSASQFRTQALEALKATDKRLVVNFDRQTLGQVGSGHFSPVVAYNQPNDMFLVMDVARYKLPPVWVTADLLFKAMQGKDSSSNKSRGYFIVTRK